MSPTPTSPPSKRPRLTTMSSNLTVTYTSPTSQPFTLTNALPADADKTAFLVALRTTIGETQERVNRELTERMEEDKKRDAGGKAGVDDVKEEENYGEEVQEEDD